MIKTKLAAFDLDGTLFDTRGVNFKAYQIALQEEGYKLDREFYERECNGKYYKDYLPLLIADPSAKLMEKIHNRKIELYPTCLDAATENMHLFSIIEKIRNEYYIAIVTTASKNNCMDILRWFKKENLFDIIITHNDLTEMKPSPQGYLKAMEHFEISPENTIIFEDSSIGVQAGKSSGAQVFVVI